MQRLVYEQKSPRKDNLDNKSVPQPDVPSINPIVKFHQRDAHCGCVMMMAMGRV